LQVWHTETVRGSVDEACRVVGQVAGDCFRGFVQNMNWAAKSESPIEAAFWVWWSAADFMRNVAGQEPWMPRLLPQQDVEACGNRYRLDFMLESGKIAIELDGHDFHERTKEQVEHRNKRDRDLQSDGWLVLHYSGSKFLSEPMNCILEVTAIWESRKPKAE
jgi:hypothetical protein